MKGDFQHSSNVKSQIARWMVMLAAFYFDIKHRTDKQHSNADGMSRHPLLRCAQCEIRHPGAYKTKRGKKVNVVRIASRTQTDSRAQEGPEVPDKQGQSHDKRLEAAGLPRVGQLLH